MQQTIHDLFEVDLEETDASKRMAEVLDAERSEPESPASGQTAEVAPGANKAALGILESALAAAEDETDVAAARIVRAEAAAEMDEFDESAPLANGDDGDAVVESEGTKAEAELHQIEEQVRILLYFSLRRHISIRNGFALKLFVRKIFDQIAEKFF